MTDTKDSGQNKQHMGPRAAYWYGVVVGYTKCMVHGNKTNKEQGPASERAAISTANATWVIAGFTVILGAIAWFQFQEVQNSSDLMSRMNRIYRQQAGQLSRQAANTQALAENTAREVEKMDASIKQASRLAKATEEANTNAMNADRPWFGGVLGVDGFEVGKIPTGTIVFNNSGRRPAKVTLTETATHWFREFPANPPYIFDATPSVGIIVPAGTVTSKFNILKQALSQQESDLATNGTVATFFVYANIEYADARTGEPHHAHFCWRYLGGSLVIAKGFYGCDTYNDAN